MSGVKTKSLKRQSVSSVKPKSVRSRLKEKTRRTPVVHVGITRLMPMFNERKVAQVAAYLLNREGGRMSHLKLMKLLYLVDRESMERFDAPVTFDRPVSMPHGPVLSTTLDFMNGNIESELGYWQSWISDRADNMIELRRKDITRDDLDEISDADLEVLEYVWAQFGGMTKWELRDYTHDPIKCPEWKDPEGSSCVISYSEIFVAVGKSTEVAKELEAEIETKKALDRLIASL